MPAPSYSTPLTVVNRTTGQWGWVRRGWAIHPILTAFAVTMALQNVDRL